MFFPATFCFEDLCRNCRRYLLSFQAPAAGQADVSEAGRIDVGHHILQGVSGNLVK